nr:hypothetical protein [Tanacetum cinerariifolium]
MKSSRSKEGRDVKVRRRGVKIGTLEEPSSSIHLTPTFPPSTYTAGNLKMLKVLRRKRDRGRSTKKLMGEDTPGRKKHKGMVKGIGHKKRPYEKIIQWMDNEILFPSVPGYRLLDSPIVLEAYIEGFQVRRINLDEESSSEVMYKHCFRNLGPDTKAKLRESRIPTWRRSLGAVASTINLMIKFSTANEIATMVTNREALRECRRIEEAHGFTHEGRMTHPQIRPLKPNEASTAKNAYTERRFYKGETYGRSEAPAPTKAKDTSLRNRASTKNLPPHRAGGTEKEKLSPERRKVVKEEVGEWLRAGIVKRVQYPSWVANLALVKKADDNAYKGYHHRHMSKKYKEKTAFHTDEGIFCYTKMPFGLKNVGATYQRLVDIIFEGQICRNLEAYMDDMVIKSKI